MLLIAIMKKRWEKINYTYRHKKAFLQVEKQLLGKNTFAGYTHDLLKMFSYFFLGIKITYFLHDKLNFHHTENIFKIYNYEEMVIDWECARFTKPDKPLNAYETYKKYYYDKMTLKQRIMVKLVMQKFNLITK